MNRLGLVAVLAVMALSGCAQGMDPGGRILRPMADGAGPLHLGGYRYVGMKGGGATHIPRRGILCGSPVIEYRRHQPGRAQVIHVGQDQLQELRLRRPARSQDGRWTLHQDMFMDEAIEHGLQAAARYRERVSPCPWERR
ncbi:hypothetical protein [Brevundimonas diminuta]|uniref:hypothetical protein n=1 Tax=Brevundimonas diminuta TaxID=293 RepID=UPI0030FACF9C